MSNDKGQTSCEKNACCGSASSEMSMSTVLRGTCRDDMPVGVYQQKAQRKSVGRRSTPSQPKPNHSRATRRR